MKTKTFNVQSRVRWALRKLWLWSPMRTEAVRNARLKRGIYGCSECKKEFSRKEVVVDHNIPVTPVKGFDSWDNFIDRLFCKSEGLKVMCSLCHSLKTKEENLQRKSYGTGKKSLKKR